ncbi:flagellar hook-associated protein [Yersinia alsatica]|uniref:flagellar hook-associated protein n=1 Tax=Yersinia alsatica TaxID=2890317 RepID=UPI00119D14D6|nr:flagellar hook-associated protein [Yersinia alsatica]
MQVGLNTTHGLRGNKTSSHPLAVHQHQPVNGHKQNKVISNFPDSPFISSQPLRYNVQLNQQLTSLQQAGRYLHEAERQIAQLHNVVQQGKVSTEVQQLAEKTVNWLQCRASVSANTVDRQLNIALEQAAKVNFSWQDANRVLQSSQEETLLFSSQGAETKIVAIRFPAEGNIRQNLLVLNKGLGRLGIHGELTQHGQVRFSIDEQHWQGINQLHVRGEGYRFGSESIQPLVLTAEAALVDDVRHIIEQPIEAKKYLGNMQQALTQITGQMRELNEHKQKVRSSIESMCSLSSSNTVQLMAESLASKLAQGKEHYNLLLQALNGQGNIHSLTVRNLLGN